MTRRTLPPKHRAGQTYLVGDQVRLPHHGFTWMTIDKINDFDNGRRQLILNDGTDFWMTATQTVEHQRGGA